MQFLVVSLLVAGAAAQYAHRYQNFIPPPSVRQSGPAIFPTFPNLFPLRPSQSGSQPQRPGLLQNIFRPQSGNPPSPGALLNPFHSDNPIAVTMVDRDQLIDRLIMRLESLRRVPEGTPSAVPVTTTTNSEGEETVQLASPVNEGNNRPLVAIANFFDDIFNRPGGATSGGSSGSASSSSTPQSPAVAPLNPLTLETEVTAVLDAASDKIDANEEKTKEEIQQLYREVIPYRSGALVHRKDGGLVYQAPHPAHDVPYVPNNGAYIGYIAPPRPTLRQSFQQLFNRPATASEAQPTVSGGPGYRNIIRQTTRPYYGYGHHARY